MFHVKRRLVSGEAGGEYVGLGGFTPLFRSPTRVRQPLEYVDTRT